MSLLRNLLILAAAAALLLLPMSAAADTTVKAKLVEQNDSGASGTVSLTATGDGVLRWSSVRKAWCPASRTPSTSTGQRAAGTPCAPL